jgi:hypothetical protein
MTAEVMACLLVSWLAIARSSPKALCALGLERAIASQLTKRQAITSVEKSTWSDAVHEIKSWLLQLILQKVFGLTLELGVVLYQKGWFLIQTSGYLKPNLQERLCLYQNEYHNQSCIYRNCYWLLTQPFRLSNRYS